MQQQMEETKTTVTVTPTIRSFLRVLLHLDGIDRKVDTYYPELNRLIDEMGKNQYPPSSHEAISERAVSGAFARFLSLIKGENRPTSIFDGCEHPQTRLAMASVVTVQPFVANGDKEHFFEFVNKWLDGNTAWAMYGTLWAAKTLAQDESWENRKIIEDAFQKARSIIQKNNRHETDLWLLANPVIDFGQRAPDSWTFRALGKEVPAYISHNYSTVIDKIKEIQRQLIQKYGHDRESALGALGYHGKLGDIDALEAFVTEQFIQYKYDAFFVYDDVSKISDREDAIQNYVQIFSSIQGQYYDPKSANILRQTLGMLKGELTGETAYFLGFSKKIGEDGPINFELARALFKKAINEGFTEHGNAYDQLIHIGLEEHKDSQVDDETLLQMMNRAHSSYFAASKYAPYLLSGYVDRKHKEEGARVYEGLANQPLGLEQYENNQFHARGFLVIRHMLGLDVSFDLDRAKKVFDKLNDMHPSCSRCSERFQSAGKILNNVTQFFSTERSNFMASAKIIQDIHNDITSFEEAKKQVARLGNTQQDYFYKLAYLVEYLAKEERWKNKKEWEDFSVYCQALSLRRRDNSNVAPVSAESIQKSALRTGPRYNPIAANGLPLLGVWEAAAKTPEEVQQAKVTGGAFVPQAGAFRFTGFDAIQNQKLKVKVTPSGDRPALILKGDIDVIMTLAFGSKSGPIYPSFSLEKLGFNPETKYPGHYYPSLEDKDFDPGWLIHTDFGKTLYHTDYLAGTMVWNPKDFKIADYGPSHNYAVLYADPIKVLQEDFDRTGGLTANHEQRVMLVVADSDIALQRTGSNSWSLRSPQVKLGLEGSYMNSQDRHIHRNDPRYQIGRRTQKFTDGFDEIAQLMPVFERARQLITIQHSIFRLREAGYTPPSVRDWQNKLREYERIPPAPLSEKFAARPPYLEI